MNVFVIGGGASGLTAAIKAREAGCNVVILERNNKCGKKLLTTGNGRCNFYNEKQDLKFYHSEDMEIFAEIFNHKKDEILKFFKELGIVSKVNNGYYYPFSNQASSVVNALMLKVEKLNIKVINNELVKSIKKEDKFIISTEHNQFIADKVIIAAGSKAAPKTGSDGSSYDLVKSLGHSIIEVVPSLVQLEGKDNFYKEWKGVRSDAILSLLENNQKIKEERGEVQFTDYGISGICTFNLSGIISRGLLENKNYKILINLIPWFKGNKEDFLQWMNNQDEKLKDYKLREILEGFLNYNLVNLISKLENISATSKWNDVNKEKVINRIMSFEFNVLKTKSFDNAQVCSGGVPLKEINPKTMESLKTKGLYLTGEVLDVNGDCGGYNLSFAWMSGMVAGESVIKND